MPVVRHSQLIFLLLAFACRPKTKPNALSLIPGDAPVVAWLPSPQSSLAQLDKFLATFDGESLGDQVKAIRFDWQRQLGFDPLDAKTLGNLGFDPEQPWAVASVNGGWVAVIATKDSGSALARLRLMAKENFGADKQRTSGSVTVFSEPFGDTAIDVFAVREEAKALLIAIGAGCGERLEKWPSADALSAPFHDGVFSNFQQFWKKAESDGSVAGVAARLFVRAGGEIPYVNIPLPAEKQNVQLRGALMVEPERIELMAVVLGLEPARVRDWLAPSDAHVIGVGLPAHPLIWARSALKPQAMLQAARKYLAPVLALIDRQLGNGELEQITALGNGNAEVAIELNAKAPANVGRTTAERLSALLDMLPVTATADLREANAFDALLPRLQKALNDRGVKATIDAAQVPAVLRAPSLGGSQVALSRRANTLIYGIGPDAYQHALDRLAQKHGITTDDPIFAPLAPVQTTGIIANLTALRPLLDRAPALLFGDNTMARSFVGRTLKSAEHFTSLGATLSLEGPAYEPHPTARLWVTTKK
jgi:hypothetical protein